MIAEGIESEKMLEFVRLCGSPERASATAEVHAAQGYLLGRPSETLPPGLSTLVQGIPVFGSVGAPSPLPGAGTRNEAGRPRLALRR